ncbi:hypothetical protein BJ138DRAFT_1152988 [Hygrophoropsis aurantiaca]|uniref:Uncharacterized protein n=1 Tax=Hygrophoropsis aurantiaca TaxID=72124 RepID=A0ACB8ABC9_9AGAM|nr:hypothetical protein BJ138DRAFT_1152988 [Hygrophoropsis aurantiaca]
MFHLWGRIAAVLLVVIPEQSAILLRDSQHQHAPCGHDCASDNKPSFTSYVRCSLCGLQEFYGLPGLEICPTRRNAGFPWIHPSIVESRNHSWLSHSHSIISPSNSSWQ